MKIKQWLVLMVALVCANVQTESAIPVLKNPAYYLNGTWHDAPVLGDYEKNTWTIRIQSYMRQVQLQSPQGGWTVTQTAMLRANGTYQYSSVVVSSGPTQYSTNEFAFEDVGNWGEMCWQGDTRITKTVVTTWNIKNVVTPPRIAANASPSPYKVKVEWWIEEKSNDCSELPPPDVFSIVTEHTYTKGGEAIIMPPSGNFLFTYNPEVGK
jgi:hypothetical protein